MPLSPGQTLNNRYRVESLLGKGGMGAVYRAWDNNLEIRVAVKENLDGSPEAQKQFGREARILARLSHPNLPRVTDFFFVPGQGQYLVMDYVDGEDLGQMLARLGRLPAPQVLNWVGQVCDALAYLHSQPSPVIHRDIKPTNIKIRPDGRAMLVDFGIAKLYDPHLATTIGAKAITPGYSPPEQYGGGSTDARSDIYALGATLYHLLTGKKPPESVHRMVSDEKMMPPRRINNQIPAEVEQAILKAMDVSTTRRYQNARELRSALTRQAAAGTHTATVLAPVKKPKRGLNPLLLALGGLAAIVVLAGMVALAVYLSSPDREAEASPTAAAELPATKARVAPTSTREPAATAIPTALPTATNTRISTPTRIPRDSATPTREPSRTPTPRPLPTATVVGPVTLFWDDFSVDRDYWPSGEYTFESSDGIRGLQDGAYVMTMISKKNAAQWVTVPGVAPADFQMSIDVTLLESSGDFTSGHPSARITFRRNDTTFYHLNYDNDAYRFQVSVDDNWTELISWTKHSDVRLVEGVRNTFSMVVQGSTINIYSNGVELATVNDTSISGGGDIAFGGNLWAADQTVTLAFDNLLIQSLP